MDSSNERVPALTSAGLLDGPPEAAFDRLTHLATKLLGTPVALVSLLDERRQVFKSAVGLPEPWSTARETPLSHSFCKHVVADASPLIVSDARNHPAVCDNSAIDDLGVEAYLGIPLFMPDGSAVGSLCAIDTKPRAWSARDVEILSALAGSAMAEIAARINLNERRRAEQALQADIAVRQEAEAGLRSRLRELELLYELSTDVTRARSMDEIYDRALKAVLETLGASRASLLLFDSDRVMRFKAWKGLSGAYRAAVEGHSPWTPDDSDAEPICVEDVREDASLRSYQATFNAEGILSMIFVPLVFENRVLGKFMAYFDRPHAYSDEEIRLVQTVANHVAVAIDRQTREARLRQLNETLEDRVDERTLELTVANEELQRRNDDLQSFAQIASHDLREPLRKISSFADLMLADYRDHIEDTARTYLERIQHSAVRMSSLLDDLLQYSHVATNRGRRRRVDLNHVISDVLLDLQPQIRQAGAVIEISPLPFVDADPTLMRRLFRNLINNAVKFRREGVTPQVRIEARSIAIDSDDGGLCEISVADNGIGFEDKYADRIFQPFQRLCRDEYAGSGMGLAVCRRIVEGHRGSIRVISTAGEGSTFVVELPASILVRAQECA